LLPYLPGHHHDRSNSRTSIYLPDALDPQPRQTDDSAFSTFASSRSTAGLVLSSGPFAEPLPKPLLESAVPSEFVPGDVGLSPNAPPVTGMPVAADE